MMKNLEFHPLADIFPLLEGREFDSLVADIKASGLHEAIWLYQGQILDGRNRYSACRSLGRDCATRPYTGDDPLGFVLSMNLQRRHLDESQRGMVAARLATMRQGERTDLVEISTKLSQEQAAALLHVSRETVVAANKVLQDGAAELAQAVDTGKLAVSAAVPLTVLPREEQLAALQEARHDATSKKPTAKQIRAVVRQRQGVPTNTAEGDSQTKEAEAGHVAIPKRMSPLFASLEALVNLQDLEQLLREIPEEWYDRVDQYLDTAFETLRRLRTVWKKRRHDEAEVPVQPKKSQRSQEPKKGKRWRNMKRSQAALILKAIRTAEQPLMIEALRQMPGVESGRLKRNVSRLVAQKKVQETPAGYIVVSR
jgi:hypothetical protein